MKLLVFLALVGLISGQDCPAFGSWREWSECLWLQGSDGNLSPAPMREGFMSACGLTLTTEVEEPPMTFQVPFPDKCGKCAFKIRCKNRPMTPGCFPVHIEKNQEMCEEFDEVCSVPLTPLKNCAWDMMGAMLGQCATARPDIPDWKREGFKTGQKHFPDMNCQKIGEGCKCCCHPFKPSADGNECVRVPDKPDCPDHGEWNDWSECLWHPLSSMMTKMKNHCHPGGPPPPKYEMPAGLLDDMPDKCGFCSFKIKCRSRPPSTPKKPGCFPVEADRQACGEDDCEGCGEVCTLPQMDPSPGYGKCDWNKKIMRMLAIKGKTMLKKFKNYYRVKGFKDLAKNLPHGKCVEVGDKCKCCCHPYQPNEDGTQCVLKDICKLPSDFGSSFTVNSD